MIGRKKSPAKGDLHRPPLATYPTEVSCTAR